MIIKVKDLYKGTSISDSWCDSKIARVNDMLSMFAVEVYDLYPQKIIERFAPADCKAVINTTYPITKVFGFYWKGCAIWCSEDPKDCCAWFRKLLMEEMYWDNLDQNSYAVTWDKQVTVKLPKGMSDWFIVYAKGCDEVTSLDSEIEMSKQMLALFRLYMKSEYSLEWDNDINMSANYTSKFNTQLKKIKDMYANVPKYFLPWALNAANQ